MPRPTLTADPSRSLPATSSASLNASISNPGQLWSSVAVILVQSPSRCFDSNRNATWVVFLIEHRSRVCRHRRFRTIHRRADLSGGIHRQAVLRGDDESPPGPGNLAVSDATGERAD